MKWSAVYITLPRMAQAVHFKGNFDKYQRPSN